MKERKMSFREALEATRKKAEQDKMKRLTDMGKFIKSTIKKEDK